MATTYAPDRTVEFTEDEARPKRWMTPALIALPALVILLAGFQRRWMSDDALIYVRTVRQILAGNGPVFNPGERAEASTGTLWQWLLAGAGVFGADLTQAAVYGGLLLTAAGFALAALGCLRLYGSSSALPLGAPVLLALPPVWDFATSGLETGLATCWLAGGWLLLITRPASVWTSVVFGLGPLVRPDLGLVSAVFLGAQWLLVRPRRRHALAGLGAALALPGAYEIFRAGYYGHLVPLPAVTKEASQSLWGRGLGYLQDFAGPYLLWVPVLFVLAAVLPVRDRGRVPLVPVLAPVLAGALCWAYVIKVGGDFMHGRMLLPGLFLMLLPLFLVPANRATALASVGVAVWAAVCASVLRIDYEGRVGPGGIADERGVYVAQNADPHPLHHTFAGAAWQARYGKAARTAEPPALLLPGPVRLAGGTPTVTGFYPVLGHNGSSIPLDGAALDPIGLAYPLAAHSERVAGGRVGHDKKLPEAWVIADRGAGELPAKVDPSAVEAARRALRCGALAELREATSAPLTTRRFLANLTGAFQRTAFRYPTDPAQAVRELCPQG